MRCLQTARTSRGMLSPSWTGGRSGNSLPQAIVRINAVDADWHADDLRLVAQLPPEVGVMLPKSEPDTLPAVAAAFGSRCLYALVETAVDVLGLQAMATTAGVHRLAFGNVDFGLDTGIVVDDDEIELAAVRTAFVLASRAAALPAPIDGVSLDTADQTRMAVDAVRAKRFGFGGKLCIHPCQVNAVNAAFHPSATEMEWARGVMAAFESAGGASFLIWGRWSIDPSPREPDESYFRHNLWMHPSEDGGS